MQPFSPISGCWYNLAIGIAVLWSSLIFGASVPFGRGAGLVLVAVLVPMGCDKDERRQCLSKRDYTHFSDLAKTSVVTPPKLLK